MSDSSNPETSEIEVVGVPSTETEIEVADEVAAEEAEADEVVDVGGDDADAPDSNESGGDDASTGRKRAAPIKRPYPRRSLEDAVHMAEMLRDKNGGNPWDPKEIAAALGSGTGSTFFYLTAAARDFGLTDGTRAASEIKLTELGRRVVYPQTAEDAGAALRDAFFRIDLFRQVVDYYHGSKLPEEPFRTNTLESQFGLDRRLSNEFVDLFESNCRFVKIGNSFPAAGATQDANGADRAVVAAATTAQPAASRTQADQSSDGEPPVCFIAMPFRERNADRPIGFFEEVLNAVLIPAIKAAGFKAITAKRQGSDVIQSTIVTELLRADLVVVDLTDHNPNVLFELGMRMHSEGPIALVRATGTGAIFDVDNLLRVEEYNPNLWKSTVDPDVARLTEHFKAAWADKGTSQTFMQILNARA